MSAPFKVGDTCSNCMAWKSENGITGQCHRHPLIVILVPHPCPSDNTTVYVHPITPLDHWCLDWISLT